MTTLKEASQNYKPAYAERRESKFQKTPTFQEACRMFGISEELLRALIKAKEKEFCGLLSSEGAYAIVLLDKGWNMRK